MNLSQKPIGVFDSGIGGLTVLKALAEAMPGESFVYFGDTARVPYGTKSEPVIKQFSLQNSLFLLKHEVKYIVVACNSASAVALDFLQKRLSLPVMGVIEPGVKAALQVYRERPVGVIGTGATIKSGAYQRELRKLKPGIMVAAAACPLFVPLAEEGLTEGDIPRRVAEHYLAPLKAENVATLILGCTHYPLLKPVIADFMGADTAIIDSAVSTAEYVKAELAVRGLIEHSGGGEIKFFASDISAEFSEVSRRFFGGELPAAEKVEFEVADFWV